jgi:arylsulfatase A-like enzyme
LTADHGAPCDTKGKPYLVEGKVGVPLLIKGARVGKGEDRALIEGSVDLMPSILSLAGLPIPDGLDGRTWPFLGGNEREEVFSESFYRNTYEAAIRGHDYCFNYRYPFNEMSREIDFSKRAPVVVFRRNEGRDIEVDVSGEIASTKDLYCRLERYHEKRLRERRYVDPPI